MNKSNRETWRALFETPSPKSLRADKVENLLLELGLTLHEGAGSRARYATESGAALTFHRPHKKELKAYQVRQIRDFLAEQGLTPDTQQEETK